MKTREEWLTAASKEMIETMFLSENMPPYRVACGLPSRKAFSTKNQAVGQCFSPAVSKSKHYEIFISPVLSDPIEVLDCLVHEMIHAIVGIPAGHKGAFKKLALAVGQQGKMRSSTAGPELRNRLNDLSNKLGEYPHAQLSNPSSELKKQTTRMIKLECTDCGYTLRASQKWIEVGYPTCCCGGDIEEVRV